LQSTGPGIKRLQRDLKILTKGNENGESGYTVTAEDDNLYEWTVKIFEFDPASQLHKDMIQYEKTHGVKFVTMKFHFPGDYPLSPPFVYVTNPKLTGGSLHNGALCVDVLTPQGWTPAVTAEALILQCRQLFMEGRARVQNLKSNDSWSEAEARQKWAWIMQVHKNDWHD